MTGPVPVAEWPGDPAQTPSPRAVPDVRRPGRHCGGSGRLRMLRVGRYGRPRGRSVQPPSRQRPPGPQPPRRPRPAPLRPPSTASGSATAPTVDAAKVRDALAGLAGGTVPGRTAFGLHWSGPATLPVPSRSPPAGPPRAWTPTLWKRPSGRARTASSPRSGGGPSPPPSCRPSPTAAASPARPPDRSPATAARNLPPRNVSYQRRTTSLEVWRNLSTQ